ncbi:MAG: Heparinase II/III-like, partial [uncultured Microvirga sp.]
REGLAALRSAALRLVPSPVARTTPRRLLIAPQDLCTSDPTVASDIYAGYFVFEGRGLSTGGRSPFSFPPPSPAWGEAFYGFGWLRHLRAADTALARANAKALVGDFLAKRRGHHRIARHTPVVARRLLSFLSHSPLLLDGADHELYQRFVRGVGAGVRDLERDLRGGGRPLWRLIAVVALCQASLCCEGLEGRLRRATRLLAEELERQILADGGHASRNPHAMIDLLLDLLPLRQSYASRGFDPPEALLRAIDRMLPMLRLFRHGDGALAHFNGMGVTAVDRLATILAYDEGRGQPMRHAPRSGYERLEAGRTVLIADVGRAPPTRQSGAAHAGCLSFELSSGLQRIVINCGAPRPPAEEALGAARSTAAHSTAVVADQSSARFLSGQGSWPDRLVAAWLMRRLGAVMIRGPEAVAAERPDASSLTARHDGYRERFGVIHERRWRLAPDGARLDGEDLLSRDGTQSEDVAVTIRFHLMPGVRANRMQGGQGVMLVLPNREAWRFETNLLDLRVEESVFFASPNGMRRTDQIVLGATLARSMPLHWSFERLPEQGPNAQVKRSGDQAELL